MIPRIKLVDKDIKRVAKTVFYTFKQVNKRMSKRDMCNILKTQIQLLEVKKRSEIKIYWMRLKMMPHNVAGRMKVTKALSTMPSTSFVSINVSINVSIGYN